MHLAEPKSALQRKLRDVQMHATNIAILEDLRVEMYCAKFNQGSEYLDWYGDSHLGAIGAGIKALAALIDSDIDDAHELISERTRGVEQAGALAEEKLGTD
jgi:hypothetical protein